MDEPRTMPPYRRVYTYRGTWPPLLGVLLIIPALLAFVSIFAVLLAGGALAAILLPFLARRYHPPIKQDSKTIELRPDQYSRIDSDR